jgi:hypothetical protein
VDKRYQVFVSSTYADLKEERRHVMQTLMEMDCIPAGMELFPATDEDQFEFIKRVIDDCDYYLVIIGGRYGSTTPEGISYTEKEYEYALEKDLKIIALLHEKPEDISVKNSDIDPELRTRLAAFREKLSSGRLVKFWSRAEDLPGLVSLSLSKTIKMFPAIGWMRANKITNEDLLSEINEAQKENKALKEKLSEAEREPREAIKGLAKLGGVFTVHGTYSKYVGSSRREFKWEDKLTWNDIFGYIAPYLLAYPSDKYVEAVLERSLQARAGSGSKYSINAQDFETIKIQLKAHGLVNINYTKTVQGGMGLFWSLTPAGEQLMLQLRTIKDDTSSVTLVENS